MRALHRWTFLVLFGCFTSAAWAGNGNVYLAAPDGLRIYAPDGHHLGTVTAPRPIHNLAWGGADGRTLYLTARDRLYRLPLLVGGPGRSTP